MRIDVIGKHMEATEAMRRYARQKAGKLPRHFDGTQQIVFRLEKDARNKGFHVEVVVDVEKHEDFVSHAKGADLYGAIDEAIHRGTRQLTDFKEKLKMGKR